MRSLPTQTIPGFYSQCSSFWWWIPDSNHTPPKGPGGRGLRILSLVGVLWSHPQLTCDQTLSQRCRRHLLVAAWGAGQGLAGFEGHTWCALLCFSQPQPEPGDSSGLAEPCPAGCSVLGPHRPGTSPRTLETSARVTVKPRHRRGSAAAPGPGPALSAPSG